MAKLGVRLPHALAFPSTTPTSMLLFGCWTCIQAARCLTVLQVQAGIVVVLGRTQMMMVREAELGNQTVYLN